MINKIKDLGADYLKFKHEEKCLNFELKTLKKLIISKIMKSSTGLIRGASGNVFLEAHSENDYIFVETIILDTSTKVKLSHFNLISEYLRVLNLHNEAIRKLNHKKEQLKLRQNIKEAESYLIENDCQGILFDGGIIISSNNQLIVKEIDD